VILPSDLEEELLQIDFSPVGLSLSIPDTNFANEGLPILRDRCVGGLDESSIVRREDRFYRSRIEAPDLNLALTIGPHAGIGFPVKGSHKAEFPGFAICIEDLTEIPQGRFLMRHLDHDTDGLTDVAPFRALDVQCPGSSKVDRGTRAGNEATHQELQCHLLNPHTLHLLALKPQSPVSDGLAAKQLEKLVRALAPEWRLPASGFDQRLP